MMTVSLGIFTFKLKFLGRGSTDHVMLDNGFHMTPIRSDGLAFPYWEAREAFGNKNLQWNYKDQFGGQRISSTANP